MKATSSPVVETVSPMLGTSPVFSAARRQT
jgi:hypothetical protein